MKGEKIVEERTYYVYTGDCFVLALPQKIFMKYEIAYSKKGINYVEQKLGDIVQRKMKKITDELVKGVDYGRDFDMIMKALLEDLKEHYHGANGEDLTKYGKEEE